MVRRAVYSAGMKRKRTRRAIAWLAGVAAVLALVVLFAVEPAIVDDLYSALGIEGSAAQAPAAAHGFTEAIHFVYVGQGDALLLESDGAFALLDAGTQEYTSDLITYLKTSDVKTLDYVIMSHPHADHIGAMQKVMETFEVKQLLLPRLEKGPIPTSSMFMGILQTAADKNIPTAQMNREDVFAFGGAAVRVVADGLETKGDLNLISPVLMVELGGIRLLATGDAVRANEDEAMELETDLRADVFKAAHHGSSTSNSYAFLEAVHPALVVVSCGKDNDYGHPHRWPLDAYAAVNAEVVRTDEMGSVVVWPTGGGGFSYATTADGAEHVVKPPAAQKQDAGEEPPEQAPDDAGLAA